VPTSSSEHTLPHPDLLHPRSLRNDIVRSVQRDIIVGVFQPGQRVVERELIARFGVSSIPVREALQDLENRGLVIRRPNRGCTIVDLTPLEAARICELRRVLEPQVMTWAAERITPDSVEDVEQQLQKVERAAVQQDMASFFHEDLQLHQKLWAISANTYAVRALETSLGGLFASGLNKRYLNRSDQTVMELAAEVEKHRRLVEAIKGKQGQLAASVMLEIAAGFEEYLGFLNTTATISAGKSRQAT
jgi:DNA-binding GntR family transcriptional regulator